MDILIKNIKNRKVFDLKFLESFCKKINSKTNVLEFYPIKILESKMGFQNAVIRSRYKENNKNAICKVLLFENSKGDLKVSVRKGFMFSFVDDLKKLQEQVNRLNRIIK